MNLALSCLLIFGTFFTSTTHADEIGLSSQGVIDTNSKSLSAEMRFGFSPYTSYLSRTGPSYPTMNTSTGVRLSYFLSPSIGLFSGLDVATRAFELNSGKISSPIFLDIPFGVEFRHSGALGFKRAIQHFRLGGFFTAPTGSLRDYGEVQAAEGKFTGGALLEGTVLFPILKNFYIGPNLGLKFGIRTPFSAPPEYNYINKVISFLDYSMGLSTSYLF